MRKKCSGYFTVEASFILPMVLFFYLIIILIALFLYCRSAISQDNFLLAMRAGRFTWGEDGYGEVIYGMEEGIPWEAQAYVKERMEQRKAFYPFFPAQEGTCQIGENSVLVQSKQKGSRDSIVKTVQRWNPVTMIREWRKTQDA